MYIMYVTRSVIITVHNITVIQCVFQIYQTSKIYQLPEFQSEIAWYTKVLA